MEPEAILIDLDGVLYVGGIPVPGAVDTISYLRENGYSFRFVSNSTQEVPKDPVPSAGIHGI